MPEAKGKKADIQTAMRRMNLLRGILALWILLGHCSDYMTMQNGIFSLMKRMNLVCVGFFFFLSGFGLENSLQEKMDYLKGFLPRKCGGLFLMAALQYLVSDIFAHIMHWFMEYRDLPDVLWRFVSSVNWFVWELMFFYLLFYLAARLIRKPALRGFILLLLTVLLIVLLKQAGLVGSWYYSSLAFPAGMLLRIGKEPLEERLHIIPALLLCLLPAAAGGAAGFLSDQEGLLSVYGKNVFCVSAVLFAALLFTLLPLKSRILAFLAKISPEIFLYQFTAASVLLVYAVHHHWEERGYSYVLCNVLLTFVLALVFAGLRLFLLGRIRQQKAKRTQGRDASDKS